VSVDPLTPRPWKHQSSHPLDQILSDLNTRVQLHLSSKISVLPMLFSLILSLKMSMKLLQIQIGSQQCKKSFINLKGKMCGILYLSRRIEQSLAPSGCSETSLMSYEQSLGTKPGWWFKAIAKKRALIMKKPLHLLQGLRLFES